MMTTSFAAALVLLLTAPADAWIVFRPVHSPVVCISSSLSALRAEQPLACRRAAANGLNASQNAALSKQAQRLDKANALALIAVDASLEQSLDDVLQALDENELIKCSFASADVAEAAERLAALAGAVVVESSSDALLFKGADDGIGPLIDSLA